MSTETNIAKMLVEQMKASTKFSSQNFGLKNGSDFPEIARELLAENSVTSKIAADFILKNMRAGEILENAGDSPSEMVRNNPSIYDEALSFFYWGLQIGRELQRREAEALNTIAEQQVRDGGGM